MNVQPLALEGAYYVEPKLFYDNRGFFFEWFNKERFKSLTGCDFNVVQFNYSRSTKGVLRGLHYQLNPYSQSKFVAVAKGKIQDVIVDIRKESATYGQHYSVVLSAEKRNQLFVPRGFAHGFLVLSDEAEILYATDNPYSPEHDSGLSYKDPALNIAWEMSADEIIVSEKDSKLLSMDSAPNNFE